MKLNQLSYFKCVCKHGNITKAAEELHISQPAITKSIRDLEEELGVTLLTRTNKNVSLTEEGRLFQQKSAAILSQLDSLIDEMRDFGSFRRNIVRIGVPATIGTLVSPALNRIAAEAFGLEAEIFEMSSDFAEIALEAEEIDLAVILLEDGFHPNIDTVALRDSSFCFCTSIENPLAEKSSVAIEELADMPIVLYYPGDLMQRTFAAHEVKPKYVLRSNQLQTIQAYIRTNLASTLQFPEPFANDPLIRTIPLSEPIPLSISLIKKKGKRLPQKVGQFYTYLGEHADLLISPKK